jgi:hypothetical protein
VRNVIFIFYNFISTYYYYIDQKPVQQKERIVKLES